MASWMPRGLVCSGLALLLLAPAARAQKVLDAKQLSSEDRSIFLRLRDGNTEFGPEHKAVLEQAAQWYVYRVTWLQYQKKQLPDVSDRQTLNDIVQDALRQLLERKKLQPREATRERQLKFIQEYGKEVIKAVNDVLASPLPVSRVNAARILAHLGESGPEEAGDAFVQVLNDPKQLDAVKLYALRGMKSLLQNVERFKKPEREVLCVQAALKFLKRAPTYPQTADPDEIEGFRYVRREAVRALAQVRAPAFVDKKKELIARPALDLVKVVSQDGFKPEPSLSERIDAAIGVCMMQSKLYPNYQPDYAAHQIGYFVVDFINAYAADRRSGGVRSLAWKVEAARLQQALAAFVADNKSTYVAAMAARATPILKSIEKDQVSVAQPLNVWLQSNAPKSAGLYKGDAKSTVERPLGGT